MICYYPAVSKTERFINPLFLDVLIKINVKKMTNTRQNRNPQGSQQGLPYNTLLGILKENLDKFSGFYFARETMTGEHGKAGQANAWLASRRTLRDKVGFSGILENLDTQIQTGLQKGTGLSSHLSVTEVIEKNASIFEGSALAMNTEDLIEYIRQGLDGVEVIENNSYKGMRLADLVKEDATKTQKLYGVYLMEQLENSVMMGARGSSIAYTEKAEQANQAYAGRTKRNVTITLPNGARINHEL